MILVEQHKITRSHSFFNECDALCFHSKNLYNQTLYNVRQHFFETKKYLSYESNYHITSKQESYKGLPSKVSCQVIKKVDKNFKSFFTLLKNKEIKNKIPNYLDKTDGRFLTTYPKQALNTKDFKKTGEIKLSQTNIFVKTQITDFNSIKEVRIVPKDTHYVIEVVYEKAVKENKGNLVAAVDVGLNNLATVTFSNGIQPFIINGKPLKSINQFYNKEIAYYKSILEIRNGKKSSKRIKRITDKRNDRIKTYLHQASRLLVNQLVLNGVKTLILGKNTNQKQDINIGKVNNQNFVQVPMYRFLDIVKYKAELEGINVVFQEESYTSKASFLNLDFMPVYGDGNTSTFSGYRVHRGLYKIKGEKTTINADVNGSYNIMRKSQAVPKIKHGIEGFGVNPVILTPKRA